MDDLLRSGRVQFAGVPLAREAAALLRLHQTLVKHFEHLELHDRVSYRAACECLVVVSVVFAVALVSALVCCCSHELHLFVMMIHRRGFSYLTKHTPARRKVDASTSPSSASFLQHPRRLLVRRASTVLPHHFSLVRPYPLCPSCIIRHAIHHSCLTLAVTVPFRMAGAVEYRDSRPEG